MRYFIFLFICIGFSFELSAQKINLASKSGHQATVIAANVSKNNKYFLSIDEKDNMIVWDISSQQQISKSIEIIAAKFSTNDESIYVVKKNKKTYRYSVFGKEIETLSDASYKPQLEWNRLLFPEENMYITDDFIFDIRKGFIKRIPIGENNLGFSRNYSPLLKSYVMVGKNGVLSFINLESGQIERTIPSKMFQTHSTPISVQFAQNAHMAVVSKGDTMRAIDLKTEKIVSTRTDPMTLMAVNISPDGKRYAYVTRFSMAMINIADGKILWSHKHNMNENYGFLGSKGVLEFNEDGSRILVGGTSKFMWLDAQTGKAEREFISEKIVFFDNLTYLPTKNKLFALQNSEKIFSIDLLSGTMDTYDPKYSAIGDVIMPDPGKQIAEFQSKATIGILAAQDGRYVLTQPHTICAEGSTQTTVFDRVSKKIVFSRPCANSSTIIANKKRWVAYQVKRNQVQYLEIIDYTTNQKLFSFTGHDFYNVHSAKFSENDNYLITRTNNGDILIYDLVTGKKQIVESDYLKKIKPKFYGFFKGFTPDEKFAVLEDNDLYFLNLQTGEVDHNLTLKTSYWGQFSSVAFTPNGKFLFSRGADGSINVLERKSKKVVAMIYPDIIRGKWAVIDSDGRFDGSESSLSSMYHVTDGMFVPLSAMFEKFYTPRLLARILAGEQFDPLPDANKLQRVPIVSIEYKEGIRNLVVDDDNIKQRVTTKNGQAVITVHAKYTEGSVSEIRLYRNGKLVDNTRNLVVDNDTKTQKVSKTFTIGLMDGVNMFKAVAFNAQRTESKPAEFLVDYRPEKSPAVTKIKTKPEIHLLVVGINSYKNPKYNLNYALTDADAFAKAFAASSTQLFAKVNLHFIKDEQATKAGITDAFAKIRLAAKADDLFLFYYAGHGVLNESKEFFLVPHDVTQMYGNENGLEQNGFSATLLQQYSKEIKAQKQLFILDACQSGGALDKITGVRGAIEEKAIAQLARSTGTHWLTASGSEQFASEFAKLGHGAFTWSLLEGLKGAADNGDKILTIKELDAYLQHKVPDVTEKHKGVPQFPASFSYGNDFPLYIIKQ